MSSNHDALCLDALYADLTLRTLLHDIRGHLAAISGWAELSDLDGHSIPEGMTRGIEGLCTLVDNNSDYTQHPLTESIVLADLLDDLPGAVPAPPTLVVQACPMHLGAVLRGARPERMRVVAEDGDFAVIELFGLPAEGVKLANRPLLSRLKELRDSDIFDPRLCTALLPTAASACSGRLRTVNETCLSILLREGN
jgi:hypothetical protein